MLIERGILVLVLLLLACEVPAAEPDEPADVAEIFARMRANLARISSIEFTSGDSNKYYLEGQLKKTLDKETTFAYSSGKYRSRYLMKGSDLAEHWRENAYDGLRYQSFFSDREILQRSSKPHYSAYGGSPPFLDPYAFLHLSSPFTIEGFLDDTAWSAAVSNAILEGREEIDGRSCQIVRIKKPAYQGELKFRIHMATELEYLPIRMEYQAENYQGSFRVTQWESVQTPTGRVILAMSTENTTTYVRPIKTNTTVNDRKVSQSWINADGLKVNHEIPAERFTIPPEQAKRVEDYD